MTNGPALTTSEIVARSGNGTLLLQARLSAVGIVSNADVPNPVQTISGGMN